VLASDFSSGAGQRKIDFGASERSCDRVGGAGLGAAVSLGAPRGIYNTAVAGLTPAIDGFLDVDAAREACPRGRPKGRTGAGTTWRRKTT
jgi:hypothetical protein